MSDEKLTSGKIISSLWWMLNGASELLIPRYTPPDWWECDLWRLTKAGFVDEYEIKLTIGDFRADFKKDERAYYLPPGEQPRRKHNRLAIEQVNEGPNRFWFVVPEVLHHQVLAELPPYAGLIVVGHGACAVRRAPTRHGHKWVGNKARILTTFYHRFWNIECRRNGQEAPPFTLVNEEEEITL